MISFCITTKNEGLCVDGLLTQLVTMLDKNNGEDEIIIIDDYSDDEETLDILNMLDRSLYDQLYIEVIKR